MDLPIRMAVKINFFNLTETSKKLLNFKSFDFGTKMGERNRKDEMEQEVDSKAECYFISFLFSLLFLFMLFYIYTEFSTLFLFCSPNGKLKKD